jgi:DDE superfamily endonuclease
MDNHGSHRTAEFILLAQEHNIIPFSFPAHLTHCMQPADVGVFQSYKHWHSKAIQVALESLDFDYTVSSFL